MRIDMHCHVIGNGKDIGNVDHDVYLSPGHNQHWFTRLLANLIEEDLECGVSVIAAHCSSPVFPLLDSNEIKNFAAFMEAANSGGEIRF